jgi:small-conductance mechanosensitive channel
MNNELGFAKTMLEQLLAWVQGILQDQAIVYQLLMIVACYACASLLARVLVPQLEALARNIKGNAGLLRLLVALIRRTRWIIYTLIAGSLYLVLKNMDLPQDERFLLELSLKLAVAWLAIATLAQTVHSRALRKTLAFLGWLYIAMLLLGITDDIALLLDSAGFVVGSARISLLLMLKIVLVIGFTLWVASWIGNVIDRKIQGNEELAPGLKVLIGKIIKITLLVLALLMAVASIGIDLTAFSVLSGAIGVGIGFGLQKVVSNFISGLIILADQSIKPGDTISLGDTFGWIRELRARFVSVVTRDGREFLIPNEDFITREVINWSFSDDLVRLDVPFGVSYDANPHEVARLAVEAANSVARVVQTSKPVCWLTGFGESSLDFVLRFWIQDPQNGLTNIRGEILLALWDTFKAHGIAIPYPHRELIIRNPAPDAGPQGLYKG